MDDTLQDLLRYAAKQGVQLEGITPRRLPGRGYGMVATRDVREGETVLEVPTRALRTLATVPKAISRKLDRDVSVHGILAAHLVLDDSGDDAAWDAVLPTPDDLEASIPLLWPTKLRDLLPTPARTALQRQQTKLNADWECVKAAFEHDEREKGEAKETKESKETKDTKEKKDDKNGSAKTRKPWGLTKSNYVRAWLLVNSRTFYYTTPRSEATLPSHEDRIAMQPVADLFNHAADRGCKAAYSAKSFSFVADRVYKEGDEVPISYGAHANDALLVEYGFVLDENRWDEVSLDAVLLPRLSSSPGDIVRENLEAAGFWGSYMIDAATPGGCYRTQVALRRLLCGTTSVAKRAAWQQFVEGGGDDADESEDSKAALQDLLLECLDDMAELAHKTLAKLERLGKAGVGTDSQRNLLTLRWQQIEAMVAQAAKNLREGGGEEEEKEKEDPVAKREAKKAKREGK
ncbi:hypothetical protein SCUCBS95973_006247 [Sporothrix curviconia]|uniref:SET domain-containing protein n=1 Tax=Sporothrix curviconia TaxID=1260050 RepID=A0ABP0C4R8_9PEZI